MEDAIGESLFTFFASLTIAYHYLIAEANEIKSLVIEKPQTLQIIYELINVFATQQFCRL